MSTTTASTSGKVNPRNTDKVNPRNTDIKPGNLKNPGNKLYTDLIKDKKKAFVFANMHNDTKTKHAIVQSIYETIRKQSPSGRFLGKNTDGSFSIKSKNDAISKIKKALNENKKTIENYFRFRGQGLVAQGTKPTSATTKSTKVDLLSKATSERKIKRTISLSTTSKIATQESSKATNRTSSITRESYALKPGEEKNSSKRPKTISTTSWTRN